MRHIVAGFTFLIVCGLAIGGCGNDAEDGPGGAEPVELADIEFENSDPEVALVVESGMPARSDGPCFDQPNIVQWSTDELSDETREAILKTIGEGLNMRSGNLFVNTNRSYIVSAEIQGPGYEGDMDIITWVVRTTARMVPSPSEIEILDESKADTVDRFGWDLTRTCVERALQETGEATEQSAP